MSRIEFDNVMFGYDQAPILKELTLAVQANSFWAIVGSNGSGKSTFLSLLSGWLKPDQGSVLIDGEAVAGLNSRQRAKKLSLVQQEFVPAFGYTVLETVMMARYARGANLLFESERDRQAVQSALEATDTLDFAERSLAQLSGGERQRVFIARALAQETPVLLLDEPTSHLDLKHQVKIFDLLKQMQTEQSKTILLVTHDINLAVQYCDRVLLLGANEAYFEGPPEQILDSGRIESIFGVQGYQGRIQKEKFFVPLGRFSKDRPE
ncbi:MAG: ABC transporter ATP-binding protein [Planctomycetes bacterium]|nr:ABC transporter ATP-binding protein [Planctomycetota bacterium]